MEEDGTRFLAHTNVSTRCLPCVIMAHFHQLHNNIICVYLFVSFQKFARSSRHSILETSHVEILKCQSWTNEIEVKVQAGLNLSRILLEFKSGFHKHRHYI